MLLSACPARQHGVVVLFNMVSARIVMVSRTSSGLSVSTSETLNIVRGGLGNNQGLAIFLHAAELAHSSSILPWPLAKMLGATEVANKHEDVVSLITSKRGNTEPCNRPAFEPRGEFCLAGDLSFRALGVGTTARTVHLGNNCVKIFKPLRDMRFDEFQNELKALNKVNDVRTTLQELVQKALPRLLFPANQQQADDMVAGAKSNKVNLLAIVTSPVGVPFGNYNVGDVGFDRFIPIVQALQGMHAQNTIHCDLGPTIGWFSRTTRW